MKPIQIAMIAALAALPLSAGLTATLNPTTEFGSPQSFSVSIDFYGTLFDTDTANTCDSSFTDCTWLNNISVNFDQAGASTYLSLDTNPFFNVLPTLATCPGGAILSDDSTGSGAFDTCSGPIFGIIIAPNTPLDIYTGEVSILGGIDDSTAQSVLATVSWTLDVTTPEPASFGLAVLGLAAIGLARRRAQA